MKKLILALTLIVTCALIVGAQDVVYLKNGSVVYGSVIETIPNETVKIQAEDGLVYVYQLADVDRIVHDSTYSPVERFYEPQVLEPAVREDYLQRGFRGIADLGLHAGLVNDLDNAQFSAAVTLGYQANRFFFIGAGIAPALWVYDWDRREYDRHWDYDYYYDRDYKTAFVLPIYGALRFDFINAKVSPFLDLRGGYSVTDQCRGAYAYLGAGVRIRRCSISAGWTYQGFEKGFYPDNMGLLSIRVGFEF